MCIILNVLEAKQAVLGNTFTLFVLRVQCQRVNIYIYQYKIREKNVLTKMFMKIKVSSKKCGPPECGSSGMKVTAVE